MGKSQLLDHRQGELYHDRRPADGHQRVLGTGGHFLEHGGDEPFSSRPVGIALIDCDDRFHVVTRLPRLEFLLVQELSRTSCAVDDGDLAELAAIAVGMMIVWVGVRIIGDAFRELAEAAVDPETIEHIKEVINSDSSIRQWHKLRTRMVGREVFLDLHILVDPDLKITAAHEIAESLEKTLDQKITRPINITVHIEPDTPELRK